MCHKSNKGLSLYGQLPTVYFVELKKKKLIYSHFLIYIFHLRETTFSLLLFFSIFHLLRIVSFLLFFSLLQLLCDRRSFLFAAPEVVEVAMPQSGRTDMLCSNARLLTTTALTRALVTSSLSPSSDK